MIKHCHCSACRPDLVREYTREGVTVFISDRELFMLGDLLRQNEKKIAQLEHESAGRLRALIAEKNYAKKLERKLNSALYVRIPAGDWERTMERMQLLDKTRVRLAEENASLRARLKAA